MLIDQILELMKEVKTIERLNAIVNLIFEKVIKIAIRTMLFLLFGSIYCHFSFVLISYRQLANQISRFHTHIFASTLSTYVKWKHYVLFIRICNLYLYGRYNLS